MRRPASTSLVAGPTVDPRDCVPFIPTSMETAKRMLEIAKVGSQDVVYDLGCGDGRILALAAELFKAKKAVGYEIRRDLYIAALKEIRRRDLAERITIVNGDLYSADLSEATVITLYLTYWANKELKPKIEKETRPGTRIVSHDFEVPGWRPMRKEKRCGDTIYLYRKTAK
jgi:SAM-dependent methyltransferase